MESLWGAFERSCMANAYAYILCHADLETTDHVMDRVSQFDVVHHQHQLDHTM